MHVNCYFSIEEKQIKTKLHKKRQKNIEKTRRKEKRKTMASNNSTLTLKLLLDKKANKVLFAEVGKEAVDFLFSLLALPLGTIIKLLTAKSMVGSVGNLYKSVESLDETYLAPNQYKSSLLSPSTKASNTLLLADVENGTEAVVKKYYRCVHNNDGYGSQQCRNYVTDKYDTKCPFQHNMRTEMTFVGAATFAQNLGTGFVKGVVTYTVMDDLSVTPMSTISSITMLNKFEVKDIGSLVEKHVELDIKQGLKLLKASLQSKTVLTDVFLSNKYN